MEGIRKIQPAPGTARQVKDKTFYLGLLHQKIVLLEEGYREVCKEAAELRGQTNVYAENIKIFENLQVEIRQSEVQLADINLTMDNIRSGRTWEILEEEIQTIQKENEELRQRLASLDAQEAMVDQEFVRLDRQAKETNQRILELPAAEREAYRTGLAQIDVLKKYIIEHAERVEVLKVELQSMEEHLDQSPELSKIRTKMDRLHELRQQVDQHKEELELASLSPSEERKYLIEEAKLLSSEIREYQARKLEVEQDIQRLNSEIDEMEKNERDPEVPEIWQHLQQLRRDIEKSADVSPEARQKQLEEFESLQKLEAEVLALEESLGSATDQLDALKSSVLAEPEVPFIGDDESPEVMQVLLQKFSLRDKRMTYQMQELEGEIQQMQGRMSREGDTLILDGLSLEDLEETLEAEADTLKQAIAEEQASLYEFQTTVLDGLTAELEAKQARELDEPSKEARDLLALETELLEINAALAEDISKKEAEVFSDPLKAEVLELSQRINTGLMST